MLFQRSSTDRQYFCHHKTFHGGNNKSYLNVLYCRKECHGTTQEETRLRLAATIKKTMQILMVKKVCMDTKKRNITLALNQEIEKVTNTNSQDYCYISK